MTSYRGHLQLSVNADALALAPITAAVAAAAAAAPARTQLGGLEAPPPSGAEVLLARVESKLRAIAEAGQMQK